MKTTIDIADVLLEEAKKAAARSHTTVKALVELGLRRVLSEQEKDAGFRLRKATFKGDGLHPSAADAGWERIREMVYDNHGA